MKKDSEIFSLIKKDHRKVEALFSALEEITDTTDTNRKEIYSQIRNELELHAKAEEEAVYPELKSKELTQAIAYESVEEHGIVKYLLDKLNRTPSDTNEWDAQIIALQEAVDHHVKEEEKSMFSKMKRAFDKDELEQMAEEFQKVKGESDSSASPSRAA